jgi:hypothetical protein
VRETRRHGPQPGHTISAAMAHGLSSVPRMCARHERWHRGPGVAVPAGPGLSLPARLALGAAQQSLSSLPLLAYLKASGYAVCQAIRTRTGIQFANLLDKHDGAPLVSRTLRPRL